MNHILQYIIVCCLGKEFQNLQVGEDSRFCSRWWYKQITWEKKLTGRNGHITKYITVLGHYCLDDCLIIYHTDAVEACSLTFLSYRYKFIKLSLPRKFFYSKQFKSVQVSHILAKVFACGRVPWEKTLRFTFLDLYSILFMILQNKYIINSLTYNQDDIINYIFMALYLKLFHKKFVSYQFLLSFFSTPFALVL